MGKIRLDIDALAVESFATAATAATAEGAGTVRGRMDVPRETDPGDIVIVRETEAKTCRYTCWDTCQMTCATNCSCITFPCAGCA